MHVYGSLSGKPPDHPVTFNLDSLKSKLQSPLSFNGCRVDRLDCPPINLQLFDQVTSTNTVLWTLLDQGAPAGTVAIALQQHAGRGQWGRQWHSPVGGLYLSIALEPNLAVEDSAQLTLASAWGIATALRQHSIPVQLKWLNDLVIQDRKLGGILTETRLQHGKIKKAVIGVGLNYRNPVPATGINLEMIQTQQQTPSIDSLESLAAIVVTGCLGGYCYWQDQGVASLLTHYETLMTRIGSGIEIDGRVGQIVGVAATGALRVRFGCPNEVTESIDRLLTPGSVQLGYANPPQPLSSQVDH